MYYVTTLVSLQLYAVFFTAAASSLSNGVAIEDWCAALQNGTEAVARYT